MLAAEQRYRSGPDGPRPTPVLVERQGGCQTRPTDLSRKAERVEPERVVALDPGWKDLGFPGTRRQLRAVEQLEDGGHALGTLGSRVGSKPLPAEQEPHEIGGADGVDLPLKAIERIAVDAGQEPALAPFTVLDCGSEPSSKNEPLSLQSGKRDIHVTNRKPQ